jgi:hypothetical protein
VHDIEEERVRSEHNLNNITKAHEKINQEEKVSPYYQVWFIYDYMHLNILSAKSVKYCSMVLCSIVMRVCLICLIVSFSMTTVTGAVLYRSLCPLAGI